MILREPQFYTKFRCLGGDCPLTCCRDWEIVLDKKSIADYETAPEPLREHVARNLVTDEEGDVCFRLRPDGLCALLDGDGLCPIQRHWGEEHLCDHCGAYPRFIEEYGSLTESCQAISCPEAARLVMEEGIFPLEESDDGVSDLPFDGVDGALLAGLVDSREKAFALLTRQDFPIWARLGTLLVYADDLQSCIDWGLPLSRCEVPDLYTCNSERISLTVRLLRRMSELEPLRPEWPTLLLHTADVLSTLSPEEYAALESAYQGAHPQWELHLERLACYFTFRHWPKVVNDDLLYGRAALTAASCLAIYHLAMMTWRENGALTPEEEGLLWARFSREVEHLDENFNAMIDELSDPDLWPLSDFLS